MELLINLALLAALAFAGYRAHLNRRDQAKPADEKTPRATASEEETKLKPWEGPRPKPLTAEQVKALGYAERQAEQWGGQSKKQKRRQLASQHRSSTNLRFIYEDAQGDVTTRELKSWRESGPYIEGFCLSAKDTRTFRRDRIISFLDGEELLSSPRPSRSKLPRTTPQQLEVLFTGFSSAARKDLEEEADGAGMRVRKTVTKNLAFLVTGPNAGPSKKREAEEVGASILDEDEFKNLIETGELPA